MTTADDGAAQQYRHDRTGTVEYNVNMAATVLTALRRWPSISCRDATSCGALRLAQ